MPLIRLNKYLAAMGVASRRHSDELIAGNRVRVNNQPAMLGQKINPDTDTIVVDKKIIPPQPQKLVYYAFNKPQFVLSTTEDTHGRKTVLDYFPKSPRLFPVGRLDFESTGLIIMTNDGDLSLKLTHPRYHLPKVYSVSAVGKLTPQVIAQLKHGVHLDDGKTEPAGIEVLPQKFGHNNLIITLYQGKKRQIRRMCAALHLHVLELHRLSIGPVKLGDLAPGKFRPLTSQEIHLLNRPL